MRIRIEIDMDEREADFVRHVPRPSPRLADAPQQRAADCANELLPALEGLAAEARTWLESATRPEGER